MAIISADRDARGCFVKGSKANGRKKGVPNKITAPLKALAASYGPEALAELARLALHAENEATRVAAIKELLDRGYGKSPQAVTGDGLGGPVNITVRWLE